MVGVFIYCSFGAADGVGFVMNFVGYHYQKERERELMREWLKVGDGDDGGTGDWEEREKGQLRRAETLI